MRVFVLFLFCVVLAMKMNDELELHDSGPMNNIKLI